MLHGDDNLVESKMKSTRCSKYSQQSAFSSFIILGTEKHFLSSCFHSLILSFVSTSHPYTHTSLMRNGKIMREREPFRCERERESWKIFRELFSVEHRLPSCEGKTVLCSFAIRAHTRLEKTEKRKRKKLK